MRVLIVEDDFTSRKLLQKFLSPYGDCDIAVDGKEALEAYKMSWVKSEPYDLICMDIMMPNVDGQEALKKIREIEKDMGIKNHDEVKVVMTTVLDDPKNVFKALNKGGATSYIIKPISKQTLLEELRKLGLII
ncbi:MAG TPA: response regulator [Nitrospirae bacterium]|nr:transcriptional activator protein CzcR [bacterium BMS3Abin06]HDH11219.1 response regulator [Nitrospirota bacterium]HDZ02460.1 response regulator [Nitrospirota bacterium]